MMMVGEKINMEMTPAQIAQMYREAKDKNRQVSILADLNCCKREDIIQILKDCGFHCCQLPRKRRANKQSPEPEAAAEVVEAVAVEKPTETAQETAQDEKGDEAVNQPSVKSEPSTAEKMTLEWLASRIKAESIGFTIDQMIALFDATLKIQSEVS